MASPKSDLYVITKAKELAKYVVVVTEKSPKKYRFTLVVRLQNYCLDILEHLLLANTLPLQDPARLSGRSGSIVPGCAAAMEWMESPVLGSEYSKRSFL